MVKGSSSFNHLDMCQRPALVLVTGLAVLGVVTLGV